tara:strand:- start:408 stop:656 length:249 start_codon:yes stop_codon:yes gene_type:complete
VDGSAVVASVGNDVVLVDIAPARLRVSEMLPLLPPDATRDSVTDGDVPYKYRHLFFTAVIWAVVISLRLFDPSSISGVLTVI